jgi:acyl-lipid omega-6 desaturase (Delta-12 desaturase)
VSAVAFSVLPALPAAIDPRALHASAADRATVLDQLKRRKRALVDEWARSSDPRGWTEASSTLLPLAGLWLAAGWMRAQPGLAMLLLVLPMSLLLLRCFSLLHDCGHGSLFRSARLNRAFGFVFGVLSGMPQYVWSQHHHYHHTTNGNWSRYRGPLAILSVDEFDALTPEQQRRYVRARNPALAPLAGLMYLIMQPRVNWLRGTLELATFVLHEKRRQPEVALRDLAKQFRTRRWNSAAEYRHMTLNNLVLLALWLFMSLWLGPALFFGLYLLSAALSGAAGLVLFTVQHNFEHSYAGDDQQWDYDEAALYGSSFLVLPGWMNWCTANIGYHHLHHLSARIPSYRLAACHAQNAALFAEVPRLTLADIRPSLDYLLWSPAQRRLLTVAEHRADRSAAAHPERAA